MLRSHSYSTRILNAIRRRIKLLPSYVFPIPANRLQVSWKIDAVVCNHANESTDGEKALSPMLLDKKFMTVILITDNPLDAPNIRSDRFKRQ
jgi:hypothetical protein